MMVFRNGSTNGQQPLLVDNGGHFTEIAEFWGTHSAADYWDQTHEVDFEVRATRRRQVTLAPEVYEKLIEQARMRGILPVTLVNLWLAE